ncbi:MAG: integrin alpha [Phycisphaerae bacterium]
MNTRLGFSSRSTLAVAGLLSILAIGGCPVAQVPRQTNDNANDNSSTTTTDQQNTTTLPRPITPPPTDNTGSGTDSSGQSGSGSSGAGGSGSNNTSSGANATVTSPITNTVLRVGDNYTMNFRVRDQQGALTGVEFVLARDDNADVKPDGSPIFAENVSFLVGDNGITFSTSKVASLIQNGASTFLPGVRYRQVNGTTSVAYAPSTLRIDNQIPTAQWLTPQADALVGRDNAWQISIQTNDTSSRTVRILLDPDQNPLSGNEFELIPTSTITTPGTLTSTFSNISLQVVPANTYYYYAIVSDGVQPPVGLYARSTAGADIRLAVTSRIIGDFDLSQLTNSDRGAIMQGFNFNDLAGSAMEPVPDLDGDGVPETLFSSRFGKPYIMSPAQAATGIGFGESYLIYGDRTRRLKGSSPLNAVGNTITGLTFPGIRSPVSTSWTEGMSDVAVIPDMDGDGKPELVFGFPRVESVSLSNSTAGIQHPDLFPDVGAMGAMEYDAYSPFTGWRPNEAQFTRGGIVIVSSSAPILGNKTRLNRKGDRLIDLHEVGQLFSAMGYPGFVPYVKRASAIPGDACEDCTQPQPGQTEQDDCGQPGDGKEHLYDDELIEWDVVFTNQGPGGFLNAYTGGFHGASPFDDSTQSPPLCNYNFIPYTIPSLQGQFVPINDHCGASCEWIYQWFDWSSIYGVFPATITAGNPSWHTSGSLTGGDESQASIWSGFYGGTDNAASPFADPVGCRILGQRVGDQFGTTLAADDDWLYISAPKRTALKAGDNVPDLAADRPNSGVIYQLRTNSKPFSSPVTQTQLWIEPGQVFPNIDAQLPNREDWTMPVPHQYVIEDVGSFRIRDRWLAGMAGTQVTPQPPANTPNNIAQYPTPQSGCFNLSYTPQGGLQADAVYFPGTGSYFVGTAAYYTDRTPQIVGPHADAEISFVRTLGDVNGDGVRDFAVGSDKVRNNVVSGTGPQVGGVFIVYGRPTGLEGDYLLERLALDAADPGRLNGVLLRGNSAGETLARTFDSAGDFNGDGYADVIVGNEGNNNNSGEAIIMLGSPTLLSPIKGWTVSEIVAAGKALRFRGAAPGDLVGANVAPAGDVDRDGFDDVLISAPGAMGGKGVAYLIYGTDKYNLASATARDVDLGKIGTVDLPGARFVGRNVGDQLGGGRKVVSGIDPANGSVTVYSRGVSHIGDIDGDGRADYAISAMLADPLGRTDAGEIYILYGRGD